MMMSLRRLLHVGAALDVARCVAGADAVGRLAGAVRGAHEAHAARRQNHGHVAVPHQLLRALERHRLHPSDDAGGAPAPAAASAMISTALVMHRAAEGCGLITIGQRAFSAMSTL